MSALLSHLRGRTTAMVEALEALVATESPSDDPEATDRCAARVGEIARRWVGAAPRALVHDGRRHLHWCWGRPRVLLLGHLDTVWPLGTTARWPFAVRDGRATGPGVFDMKSGLVQGLAALSALDDLEGVSMLVTCDEEVGSPTSRALIEELGRDVEAALVLEPSAEGGALKVGRSGVSGYRLAVHGRAAHPGLAPGSPNALEELATQIRAVSGLSRPSAGTFAAPTVAQAGTRSNVIPASAWIEVDVRVASVAEQARVDQEIRALASATEDLRVEVTGGPNRPPLEERRSEALFSRAQRLAADLGLAPLTGSVVGGASDGNFVAALGVPTLDGLGAVGGGAHAEGEHVLTAAIPERSALVAALVSDVLAGSEGLSARSAAPPTRPGG